MSKTTRSGLEAIGRPGLAVVAIGLALASCPAIARAQKPPTPAKLQGPGEAGARHVATGAGLMLTLDNRWLMGAGYRPVRITLAPTAPVNADRRITLRYEAAPAWSGQKPSVRVGTQVELPAGTVPVSTTLAVPQASQLQQYRLTVIEGGRVLKALSLPANRGWFTDAGNAHAAEQPAPYLLAVADAPVEFDAAQRAFLQFSSVEERLMYWENVTLDQLEGLQASSYLRGLWAQPEALPSRAIDYASVDVICLSWSQLQRLIEDRPQVWSAIRDWTAAGGNLVVYGLDATWAELPALETHLQLTTAGTGDDGSKSAPDVPPGWQKPDGAAFGMSDSIDAWPLEQEFEPGTATQGMVVPPAGVAIERAEEEVADDASGLEAIKVEEIRDRLVGPKPAKPVGPPFLTRRCMMGMVVVSSSGDLFCESPYYWGWILNTLGETRWNWTDRHGLTRAGENPDFFEFLIHGVGTVPATAFRVLITLFVLAIGPLNYFLLYRWRRLHLLVFTVPGCALLVTLGLFGYAIFDDGLSTRVRARSYSIIDQRTGRAARWARLSYYAGMAPRRGLAFSERTVVLPLEFQAGDWYDERTRLREVYWRKDSPRQWLPEGWIQARMPMQLLTVSTERTERRLEIDEPGADQETLGVRNALGAPIEQLVVRDHQGRMYRTENLAVGASAELERVEDAKALGPLRELMLENRPAVPVGFDQRGLAGSGRWGYVSTPTPTGPASAQKSLLEQALLPLSVPEAEEATALARGQYIAVTPVSPGVELGIDVDREEGSIHVVRGEW